MASNLHTFSGMIAFFIILSSLCKPAHAFGAGSVPEGLSMKTSVWKHGDIGDVLKFLPISFLTNYGFTKMDIMRVYFGNWLRDYSQLIEIMPLTKAKEPTLRAVVSVLGFMRFGLATEEFDVTKKRLGCYRPEEHIDNPRGYAEDKKRDYIGDKTLIKLDERLRHKVEDKEWEVDPKTGMKNYIANESIGIMTSAGYIRKMVRECVEHGRVARRKGNESERHEALICLGALLHTLEDFSAHSNYVELVLHSMGEKDIFAFVGDKFRVTVPSTTQEVAPLVTGTFGSLDVFQSIIGEVDDKAAMKSEGELGELGQLEKILASAPEFDNVAATIATSLQFVVKLFPDGAAVNNDFQRVLKSVQTAESDNSAENAIDINTEQLWTAMEPVFSFQGRVKRFLIESKEHPQIGLVTKTLDKLGELADDLVYSALAILIEPAVQKVREAIKDGKESIEEVDRQGKNYINIFADASTASDPSHSILAKDHFSNYLNPIAGRVATATTNWATQWIVKCWDSDDDTILVQTIEEIIKVFHHPAFALAAGQSFIQKTMYQIVETWWNERTPSDKSTLRAHLGKAGIYANADGHYHGDNNPVEATRQFAGKTGYALEWAGSQPPLTKRPAREIPSDVTSIVNALGETVVRTEKLLRDGEAKAVDLIKEGVDAAGKAVNQTVDSFGKSLKRGLDEATGTLAEVTDGTERAAKKFFDEGPKPTQETLNGLGNTLISGARDVEDFRNKVTKTGGEAVKQAENFVSNTGNTISQGAQNFSNKVDETLSGWGRSLLGR